MKKRISPLHTLIMAALAATPAVATAATLGTDSAYDTDTTSAYVQDQTSEAMGQLNNILCYVGAMAPADMVNAGNYIALIDQKTCNPNDGGGQGGSTNSGANYEPVIVNSSRANTTSPMNVKVWIDQPSYGSTIKAYASATQAPTSTNPYGLFRLDYAESGGNTGKGYIYATTSGLAFYQEGSGTYGGNTYGKTLQLKLNAGTNTQTSGSGTLKEVETTNSIPTQTTQFDFAYNSTGGTNNKGFFLRSDGTTQTCFSRDPAQAAESVWSYGLYDSGNGSRIERNSGFPIVYTDLSSQTEMNGYVGYWGLWTPTTVDTTKVVKKIDYNNVNTAAASYNLLQTGGKLLKYTKVTKQLSALDKIKFQFWAQVSVPGVTMPAGVTPTSLTSGTGYEVWWDQTNGTFRISGQQDTATYNIVPFSSPVALSIADMQLAAPYGIHGWSQMLGGNFAISGADMATLGSATTVVTNKQDVVYPTNFAGLGGLSCLDRCPTRSAIDGSNATPQTATDPYAAGTNTWTGNPAAGKALYTYILDNATGNLVDAVSGVVISTATSGPNAWGVSSGRLVAGTDLAALNAAVTARSGSANQYIEQDIDSLNTYYEWRTSGNNWDQLAMLYSGTTEVTFDPPLNVNYSVTTGTLAGATITLQYGGFGNLWGIPSTCVDASTNQPCTFGTGGTANNLQRWTPQFSLPAGASVTVPFTQGSVTTGTTYLVKALNKEVRLAKVLETDCIGSGLSVSTTSALPDLTGWSDPTSTVGVAPTFNPVPAPRVIHGVKMY